MIVSYGRQYVSDENASLKRRNERTSNNGRPGMTIYAGFLLFGPAARTGTARSGKQAAR